MKNLHQCRDLPIKNCPAASRMRREFALDLYVRGEKTEVIQTMLGFAGASSVIQIVRAAGAPLRGHGRHRRPVEALQGDEVIHRFPSAAEAGRAGFKAHLVWMAANGRNETHLGLRWRYAA